MRRIKIIKDHDNYRKGQVVDVTPNIAHGLIDSGVAQLSKDIVSSETVAKSVKKKVKHGGSRKPRTNVGK